MYLARLSPPLCPFKSYFFLSQDFETFWPNSFTFIKGVSNENTMLARASNAQSTFWSIDYLPVLRCIHTTNGQV